MAIVHLASLNSGEFFPQTAVVEELLSKVVSLLKISLDSVQKREVLNALEPFRKAIVPSELWLNEVKHSMEEAGVKFDLFVALDILLDAAYDVDLNYAKDAIEYHVDEYISSVTQ